jgi:hypothetical protein
VSESLPIHSAAQGIDGGGHEEYTQSPIGDREVIVPVHGKLSKPIAVLLLGALAFVGSGARCIENTAVREDNLGRTHIYGEFYNDTDVQGVQIILSGKLLDAQGNVIAEAQAPTCPPDTQPHSQSMFDVEFPEAVTQAHASFEVRPIAGKVLDAPLPDPGIVVLSAQARRFNDPPYVLAVTLGFLNRSQTTYTNVAWINCTALYDQTGKVVGASTGPICWADNEGFPLPGGRVACSWYMIAPPPEAVELRAWVYVPGSPALREVPGSPGRFQTAPGATSPYQFFMSDKITIH